MGEDEEMPFTVKNAISVLALMAATLVAPAAAEPDPFSHQRSAEAFFQDTDPSDCVSLEALVGAFDSPAGESQAYLGLTLSDPCTGTSASGSGQEPIGVDEFVVEKSLETAHLAATLTLQDGDVAVALDVTWTNNAHCSRPRVDLGETKPGKVCSSTARGTASVNGVTYSLGPTSGTIWRGQLPP
jgi:hypothetical protein